MSINPEVQKDGNLLLKFHHNAVGDNISGSDNDKYSICENFVSVPIAELQDYYPKKDSVELRILFPETLDTSKEERIWYKY
jgi:hypothetical protein